MTKCWKERAYALGERKRGWITYCEAKKTWGAKMLKHKGNPKRFHHCITHEKVLYSGIPVIGNLYVHYGKGTFQEYSSGEEHSRFWLMHIRSVTIK